MAELGNTHRCRSIAKGVLDNQFLSALAQYQSDGRVVAGVLEHVIDRGQVEVHLAGVFWFEWSGLEIFCGARRYVALGPSVSDLWMAYDVKRHIISARPGQSSLHFAARASDVARASRGPLFCALDDAIWGGAWRMVEFQNCGLIGFGTVEARNGAN